MLRITTAKRGKGTLLELEGQLAACWVAALEEEVERARTAGSALELGLEGLIYADRTGVALLRRLVREGARLRRAPAFLDALIRGGAGRTAAGGSAPRERHAAARGEGGGAT